MGRDDGGSRTRARLVRIAVENWSPGTVAFGDDIDATFKTEFDAPLNGMLRFEGIATLATISVDGAVVANSRSMWVPVEVPLARGQHRIEVHCRALAPELEVPRKPRSRWRQKVAGHNNLRWFRTTLNGRAPGFAPGPPVVGLWRPVWFASGEVSFDVRTRLDGDEGVVTLSTGLSDGIASASAMPARSLRAAERSCACLRRPCGGRTPMASRIFTNFRSKDMTSGGGSASEPWPRPATSCAMGFSRRSTASTYSCAARSGLRCLRVRCARRWRPLAITASTPFGSASSPATAAGSSRHRGEGRRAPRRDGHVAARARRARRHHAVGDRTARAGRPAAAHRHAAENRGGARMRTHRRSSYRA